MQVRQYRFYFFSREEKRMHVHVTSSEGEAKFWLEPMVALATHQGLSIKQLNQIKQVVERRRDEIVKRWHKHFSG